MIDDASAAVDSLGKPRPLAARFPNLTDQNIRSFHSITPHAITGPARLYRILAPSSSGMSDCWVSEEVFKALQRSENPKAAWRKFLAVWPDWNVNGQFVIYEIKAGETLNTWRGLASSQSKASLPGLHLEGGWEQILFNIERSNPYGDTVRYYKKPRRKSEKPLGKELSQSEVNALTTNMSTKQKEGFFKDYTTVREQINHPNILGPFTTGWGYTEFEGALASERIGLPALPGQLVNRGI